jgi:signal transduction histidine kinase
MNEELTTLSFELKDKVDGVSRANADLQNLIASTDLGVVFLDRNLLIKRFTPRAQDLLVNAANYTPAGGDIDIGADIHGDNVVIMVRDNGVGMTAERMKAQGNG